jgi:hypothetical protein
MTWYGNDPAIEFRDIESLRQYIRGLNYSNWRPSNFAIHNTASPTLYQWWHSVPPAERMVNLQHYYEHDMGWSSGPHFFIDGKSWWCMTPPNVRGVHSPSWNGYMLGFECVGDYATESDETSNMPAYPGGADVMKMAHALSGEVCAFFGWDPGNLKFHKEDPATSHDCPGKNMVKSEFIEDVREYMGSGGGDTDTPPDPRPGIVSGLAAGDTLNIRASSSSSAPIIGEAENEDAVTVVNEAWNGSTLWYRIKIGEAEGPGIAVFGWVSAAYVTVEAVPPPDPGEPDTEPPEQPDNPFDVPLENRPTLSRGDEGADVRDLQWMLNGQGAAIEEDGDFGGATEDAVRNYQASRGLSYDGVCGPQTWEALYEQMPALPPPPHALSQQEMADICEIANASPIRNYHWRDRSVAPQGYTQGMACAFAQTMKKLTQGHPAAVEMAKSRVPSDKDALHIYQKNFAALGMSNDVAGLDTLRHLYALMLGSGMRESSGRHCEGRDQSASNTTSDTAEAGLFQTSWNAHSASDPEFSNLMAEYGNSANKATCYLGVFDDGVSCSSSEWDCYGSGQGYEFQKLCKECPAFATETHGLTLRNLANHYGPITRKEVELKSDAERMFRAVQDYMDEDRHAAKSARRHPKGKTKVARR